jgi:hypothetical protein
MPNCPHCHHEILNLGFQEKGITQYGTFYAGIEHSDYDVDSTSDGDGYEYYCAECDHEISEEEKIAFVEQLREEQKNRIKALGDISPEKEDDGESTTIVFRKEEVGQIRTFGGILARNYTNANLGITCPKCKEMLPIEKTEIIATCPCCSTKINVKSLKTKFAMG